MERTGWKKVRAIRTSGTQKFLHSRFVLDRPKKPILSLANKQSENERCQEEQPAGVWYARSRRMVGFGLRSAPLFSRWHRCPALLKAEGRGLRAASSGRPMQFKRDARKPIRTKRWRIDQAGVCDRGAFLALLLIFFIFFASSVDPHCSIALWSRDARYLPSAGSLLPSSSLMSSRPAAGPFGIVGPTLFGSVQQRAEHQPAGCCRHFADQ